MPMAQNQNRVIGSIRPGEVSAIYPERGTARVRLPDLGVVTAECRILFPACVKSHDYRMPEVGETVIVAFLGTGIETGFILGCIYTASDAVPVADPDVRHWSMEGAGVIEMNRRTRTLVIMDSYGSVIKMANGDIILKSNRFILLNPDSVDVPAHLLTLFD